MKTQGGELINLDDEQPLTICERAMVARTFGLLASAMHANERQEERTARDAAPAWAFEPRHVAEGFDWADGAR